MKWIKYWLRRAYRAYPRTPEEKEQAKAWLWRWTKKVMIWFFALSIGSTILFSFVPIGITPLMVQRSLNMLCDSEQSFRFEKDWVSFDNISPNMQLAAVCSEDQEFLEHEGFDFDAIEKAIEHNKRSKRKWGASTISQQTAKNVFLWPTRSWLRKGFEFYFTILIELIWSKERIMTVYLNVIEFGDGIYGVEAASRHFFNKPAKDINVDEAALLAAVLPNPHIFKVDNPTAKVRTKQQRIKRQMRAWGGKIDYEDPNTPGKDEN